jgi:predicted AAA+ superfamily ATPase
LETFRGITDSLIGRKKIIQVHSLSFMEFLEYKQFDIKSVQVISLENKNILNAYLDEFISYGSYPRVVMENSLEKKLEILNNLYNDYIYKDI